ncbi:polysaccharide pyruvyl transferase CsaB [Abditibacterium utsteinense]|uniref:Polysaccharide pyruvyl transferase CsaB n=1 Tax=Abditibacterium utsteinense TaxID=1960156 RepID=A0A2S8SUJ3_9BACT|nr:polysaccharide pyruvyl transferase CsaB [Abditibacterium utsteinense]PQV64471.1 polysaccharide pyruvyl transferase CsaB [Abditibacterium utsteinense]
MKFLLNGYFGFDNAGDEAVLAAMLADLRALSPSATFVATSGNPAQTTKNHGCAAIGRQNPRGLFAAISSCDVFISGGGSLVQDVTSFRNVVYYTTLLRLAKMMGKKTMVYAQGVGPLSSSKSRRLARKAFQSADILTVRDPDSAALLREIGVSQKMEVTADPVWNLAFSPQPKQAKTWGVALRGWPHQDENAIARIVGALRAAANAEGATLQFLAMQPGPDQEILQGLTTAGEILETRDAHPSEIVGLCASFEVMIAMRLHALIFAASAGVPTVAMNYDPKVASLATLLGAPLLPSPSPTDLATLPTLISQAKAVSPAIVEDFRAKARRNAELAIQLAPS